MTAPTNIPRALSDSSATPSRFAHELVWKYHFDPVTGAMTTFKADPPPTYYHRCFVMARSTRQFFYHARFEPELPPVG